MKKVNLYNVDSVIKNYHLLRKTYEWLFKMKNYRGTLSRKIQIQLINKIKSHA